MARILLLIVIFTLSSCSMMHKMGIKASAGAVKKAGVGMESEYDFKNFETAAVANLSLIEGLLYIDPENQNLLSTLIKGHAGLGFGVHETRFLADFYAEKDKSIHKTRAIEKYTKAMHLTKRFFKANGASFDEFVKLANDDKKAQDYLNSHFSSDDNTGLFFTGQAWGSLINLQRENITLLAQLNGVKNLFDFVCGNDPGFSHGSCDVFYGAYYLGRPKTLGGDPDKGRQILKKLVEKNENNLLSKVSYLQFYAIAYENEDEFNRIEKQLVKDSRDFNKLFNYANTLNAKQRFNPNSTLNLFNAIAIERFKIMKKYKKEFF